MRLTLTLRTAVIGGLLLVAATGLLVWAFSGGPSDLLAEATSPEPRVRAAAVAQLSAQSSNQAVQVVAGALKDSDASVASAAVRGVALQNRPEAHQQVKSALEDPRPAVRAAAAGVLGRFADKNDLDKLIRILGDQSQPPEVRASSADSLAMINRWPAMTPLVNALEDESSLVRGRAAAAIHSILKVNFRFPVDGSPEERARVLKTIREWYPGFERAHADYLRRIGKQP